MAAFEFEPETSAFIEEVAHGPATENLSIEQLREGYRTTVLSNSVAPNESVRVQNMSVAAGDRQIAVRLYIPDAAPGVTGLLLYVHGGGFAVGDLDSHDPLLRLISSVSGQRVLALHYRRAPEHPYPAARDDVLAVFEWARANAATFGADNTRIALGGESAGATHAVMAALALKHNNPVKALWLLVPALDPAGSGESHKTFATGAGRTAAEFAYLWSLYLPDPATRRDAASILADPTGLPPTWIYTAEFDPARDDGEAFAEKARNAGVASTLRRQRGLVHQFPEITRLSPASRDAVIAAARDLAAAVA